MANKRTVTQSEFRSLARRAGFNLKIKSYSDFAAVTHVNGKTTRSVSLSATPNPILSTYHEWNRTFQVLDGDYRTVK